MTFSPGGEFPHRRGPQRWQFRGTPYGDGDFCKLMEDLIYDYTVRRDPEVNKQLDEYIALIAKAQQPDGYLSTKQIIGEQAANGVSRHGDENDYGEYNFGQLFTAACMHKRVTGKDTFLKVAVGAAAYVERVLRDNKTIADLRQRQRIEGGADSSPHFYDQYGNRNWGAIFVCVAISMMPMIIICITLNKWLIEGMTAGAVKD